jgi:alpha-tubulin suppressor-like RCC1 family protein
MNLGPSYSSLSHRIILYTQEGELWEWGDNRVGNVGTGDTLACDEPRRVNFNEKLIPSLLDGVTTWQ